VDDVICELPSPALKKKYIRSDLFTNTHDLVQVGRVFRLTIDVMKDCDAVHRRYEAKPWFAAMEG
jgi:hypothetical protein